MKFNQKALGDFRRASQENTGSDTVQKSQVGAGLLSATSQHEKLLEEYPMIKIDDIIPNKNNHYEMKDIDLLKESIENVGLQQPLVVYVNKENGKYTLLTGHRRLVACKQILSEGNNAFKRLPCKIVNLDSIELPLSNELKERYAIITTNMETRTLSSAEMQMQYSEMKTIFDELERQGKKPKGRRRELIAQKLGVSPQSVARMEQIDKKTSNEVKEEFLEGKIDLATTTELTKHPVEKQTEILQTAKKQMQEEKQEENQDQDFNLKSDKQSSEPKVTKKDIQRVVEQFKAEEQNEPETSQEEPEDSEWVELSEEEHEEEMTNIGTSFEGVADTLEQLQAKYRNQSNHEIEVKKVNKIKKKTDELLKITRDLDILFNN